MKMQTSKRDVLIAILGIFSVIFSLFFYQSYQHTKLAFEEIDSTMDVSVEKLFDEASTKMLQKALDEKSELLMHILKDEKFLELVEKKDRTKLISILEPWYTLLKKQLSAFQIMHIIDSNGTSILRMHAKNMYGDNLKDIRLNIQNVVSNPMKRSYYEVGKNGLYYRNIQPLYNKKRLVGFLELGMRPSIVVKKIKSIFGMNGYIFAKNNPLMIRKNLLEVDGYSLCPLCSKKDDFITTVAPQLKMGKVHYEVNFNNAIYHSLNKPIYDGFKNEVGKIILFQDVTFFHNQLVSLFVNALILYIVSLIFVYFIFNKYIGHVLKRLNKSHFILNHINDSVIVLDPKTGYILEANAQAETTLGYANKELLGKHVNDIKESMLLSSSNNWKNRVQLLKVAKNIVVKTFFMRKDGTKFPIEANLTYLKTDDEEFVVSVGRDISLQMEQEKLLKKQHNEMKRLNELISEGVLYTTADLDGKITFVSKAFEKFTGFTSQELLGKNHNIFKHKDTTKEFFKNMWSVLKSNQQFQGEVKNRKKDGSAYWVKLGLCSLSYLKAKKQYKNANTFIPKRYHPCKRKHIKAQ